MEKNEKEQISEEETEKSIPPIDPWSDLLFGRQIKSEKKPEGDIKKEIKEEKAQDDKEQGNFFLGFKTKKWNKKGVTLSYKSTERRSFSNYNLSGTSFEL